MIENCTKAPKKGMFTLPTECGQEKLVLELARKWRADALRDSDGTIFPPELVNEKFDIYSTICLVRAEQKFPRDNPQYQPLKFFISNPVVAQGTSVEIDLTGGFYEKKYAIDSFNDVKKYWQVHDRTTDELVDTKHWEYNPESQTILVQNVTEYHSYTANFLVRQTWDSTSQFNHVSNNWTTPPVICTDPAHEEAMEFLIEFFDKWLEEHDYTTVVRLTTLAYHFVIDSDADGLQRMVDWFGYAETISIPMLESFEKKHGYAMTAEDFVQAGNYNSTHTVPTKKYMDWIEHVEEFVIKFGRELIQKVHAAGKTAAMFWGDHWIGAEPYSPKFADLDLDILIGAPGFAHDLRRLAESPYVKRREARLYPYMFPPSFQKPVEDARKFWIGPRRALVRTPIDRIGYGGYVSLAGKNPDFVEYVSQICDEFDLIRRISQGKKSRRLPVKVAVLNAWGKLRSWTESSNSAYKFGGESSVSKPLEALAGLPVDVEFISFNDIVETGGAVLDGIDVLLNEGQAGTAWSGGACWKDPKVILHIRKFVHKGGGFVGVDSPTACLGEVKIFQLEDILGVQKEIGLSTNYRKKITATIEHFITADCNKKFDAAGHESFVYPVGNDVKLLSADAAGHTNLAINEVSQGRSVYSSALPYNANNTRLLLRAILWAAKKEDTLYNYFSTNPEVEVAAWDDAEKYVMLNNSSHQQETTLYFSNDKSKKVTLKPYECIGDDCDPF